MASGDDAAAIEALETARRRGIIDPHHAYLLGNALMNTGQAERAAEAFRESIHLNPSAVRARINLGNALRELGDLDGAIASYREALRHGPDHAGGWCNLGLALGEAGRYREALEASRRGHELGQEWPDWSWPSAELVAEHEALVAREERCAAVVAGEADPVDAEEIVLLADLCRLRDNHRDAARLFRMLFESQGERADAKSTLVHRFRAACSAALAGTSDGSHLSDGERAAWRTQARRWLAEELASIRDLLASGRLRPRRALALLEHWQEEEALAGVRKAEALEDLPSSERPPWSELWRAIDTLIEALH
jgi:tetratricopeptide (TPR) repeat protein